MSVKEISSRQIFGVKKESLEKRIVNEYAELKDDLRAIQFAFAILLRNALTVKDFSGMLTEIVHDIFLFSEPNDTLRNFAPFFKSYFKGGEWETVITRLYATKKEYHLLLDKIRPIKKLLEEKTTPIEELKDQQYKIVATFLNENGKRHSWTLRDADPNVTSEKFQVVAALLRSLTVFTKEDARLFQEIQSADLMNCTCKSLVKKETKKVSIQNMKEEADKSRELNVKQEPAQSASTEEELSISLPEGIAVEDLSQEDLLDIVKKQLPEGATLTGLRLGDEDLLKKDLLQPPIDYEKENMTNPASIPLVIEDSQAELEQQVNKPFMNKEKRSKSNKKGKNQQSGKKIRKKDKRKKKKKR